MPIVSLGGGIVATTSDFPDPIDVNRRLYLGDGKVVISVVFSSPAVARRVFLPAMGLEIKSGIAGVLKKRLLLPGTMASQTTADVKVFISTTPIPIPVGKLTLPTLDSVLDDKNVAPSFAGSRIPKGALFPVEFKVSGQQLAGLKAHFVARRLDKSLVFEKSSDGVPGGILFSDPGIDLSNKLEVCSGSFQVTEADLVGLPEEEVELKYIFYLADQLGRKYIIENGSFSIFII